MFKEAGQMRAVDELGDELATLAAQRVRRCAQAWTTSCCSATHHHHLVHEGGYTLLAPRPGAGHDGFAARTPDGRRSDAVASASAGAPEELHETAGAGPESLLPLGGDGPFDLGYAVEALVCFTTPPGPVPEPRGLS